MPRAQLALAWMLGKPGITAPIVGATKPHHLKDAVAALSVRLTPEEIAALEEPYTPHPGLGIQLNVKGVRAVQGWVHPVGMPSDPGPR